MAAASCARKWAAEASSGDGNRALAIGKMKHIESARRYEVLWHQNASNPSIKNKEMANGGGIAWR